MTKMKVPEMVVDLLRRYRGVAVCDDCIRDELGLKKRQEVQPVTATLGLCSGFTRQKGACPWCKSVREKFVTKAN